MNSIGTWTKTAEIQAEFNISVLSLKLEEQKTKSK